MGVEEAILSFAAFGGRAIGAEGGNGDGHRQVIWHISNCPRPNCGRTLSRIKGVAISACQRPDSRIAAQSGGGMYDAAGQMKKRKHGGTMLVIGWKK